MSSLPPRRSKKRKPPTETGGAFGGMATPPPAPPASPAALTGLLDACYAGDIDAVRDCLARYRGLAGRTNSRGESPLLVAVNGQRIRVVEYLLSLKPAPEIDVNARDVNGVSALFAAAASNQAEIVRLLLDDPRIDAALPSKNGTTPLIIAVKKGHVEIVKMLLSCGKSDAIVATDEAGYSALDYSTDATEGLLLEAFSKAIDERDGMAPGGSHLYERFSPPPVPEREVVTTPPILAAIPTPIFQPDPVLAKKIHTAARSNDAAFLDTALSSLSHVDSSIELLNSRDPSDGMSPLLAAASSGSWLVLQRLLRDPRVDPNIRHERGSTALILACKSGNPQSVELLLADPRVDVNITSDIDGGSAFHVACKSGRRQLVECFLDRAERVDFNVVDKYGKKATIYCGTEIRNMINAAVEVLEHERALRREENARVLKEAGLSETEPKVVEPPRAMSRANSDIPAPTRTSSSDAGHSSPTLEVSGTSYGPPPLAKSATDPQPKRSRFPFFSKDPAPSVTSRTSTATPKPSHGGDHPLTTPFLAACTLGEVDLIGGFLLDPTLDPNCVDSKGRSGAHLAAKHGQPDVLSRLLRDSRVNLDAIDKKGRTPLFLAAQGDSYDCAMVLLRSPDRVDRKRKCGTVFKKTAEEVAGPNAKLAFAAFDEGKLEVDAAKTEDFRKAEDESARQRAEEERLAREAEQARRRAEETARQRANEERRAWDAEQARRHAEEMERARYAWEQEQARRHAEEVEKARREREEADRMFQERARWEAERLRRETEERRAELDARIAEEQRMLDAIRLAEEARIAEEARRIEAANLVRRERERVEAEMRMVEEQAQVQDRDLVEVREKLAAVRLQVYGAGGAAPGSQSTLTTDESNRSRSSAPELPISPTLADPESSILAPIPPKHRPPPPRPPKPGHLSSQHSYWINESDLDIDFKHPLGRGGFAEVFPAKYLGLTDAAVKIFADRPDSNRFFEAEVKIWVGLPAHENIAPLLGFRTSPTYLVTKLYPGGSLKDYLTAHSFDRRLAFPLLYQTAVGVTFLHSKNVVHGDLKPENILIDIINNHPIARVSDFGVSKIRTRVESTGGVRYEYQGIRGTTIRFASPEFFDDVESSKEGDVWAFGMLCYSVLAAKEPFEGVTTNAGVMRAICSGKKPERPDGIADGVWEIIEACWNMQPEERPAMGVVALALKDLAGV